MYSFLFDKYVSPKNLTLSYMRTVFTLGAPLDVNGIRYANKTDRESEQQEYMKEIVTEMKDKLEEGTDSSFRGDFVSSLIIRDEFMKLII